MKKSQSPEVDRFKTLQEYGVDIKTGKLDVKQFSRALAASIGRDHVKNMPQGRKESHREFIASQIEERVQDIRVQERLAGHIGLSSPSNDELSSLFKVSSYKLNIPIKNVKIEHIDFADDAMKAFGEVDSSETHKPPIAEGLENLDPSDFVTYGPRELFIDNAKKEGAPPPPPSVLVCSSAVHSSLIEHLVLDKRETAYGTKFQNKDKNPITNGEAVVSQSVVRFMATEIAGVVAHTSGYTLFPDGKTMQVVQSFTILPDCEKGSAKKEAHLAVMRKLTQVGDDERIGEELPSDFKALFAEDKKDPEKVKKYDESLMNDYISKLTESGKIPAKDDIEAENIIKASELQQILEEIVESDEADIQGKLKGKFVELKDDSIHSLELFFGRGFLLLLQNFPVLKVYLRIRRKVMIISWILQRFLLNHLIIILNL